MTIKSELQKRITDWAKLQTPIITVAVPNVPFTKPSPTSTYIEIDFLDSTTVSVTVDALRERTTGLMSINLCVPQGAGAGHEDTLTEAIRALFRVRVKIGTVSIERPVSVSRAIPREDGFRVIPMMVSYRQEREQI